MKVILTMRNMTLGFLPPSEPTLAQKVPGLALFALTLSYEEVEMATLGPYHTDS